MPEEKLYVVDILNPHNGRIFHRMRVRAPSTKDALHQIKEFRDSLAIVVIPEQWANRTISPHDENRYSPTEIHQI